MIIQTRFLYEGVSYMWEPTVAWKRFYSKRRILLAFADTRDQNIKCHWIFSGGGGGGGEC